MNKVQLTGRLGHDVSLRYIPPTPDDEEKAVATFSLAVRRKKKDETDWIDCVAYRSTAENIHKWFHKGDRIEVSGAVQERKYQSRKYVNAETKEPATLKAVEVVVSEFWFTDGNKEKPKDDEQISGFKTADDGIPF